MSHTPALPGSPEDVKDVIFSLKEHFVHYNITRLRELIRYLPEKKLTLFHLIPFLLHVNRPDLPGYINHPVATFGVYNLMDTGIWNVAVDHFSTSDTAIAPYLSSRNHILAMYLMGSTGTLAQGDQSDFDYWVIIDENKTPPMRQRVLSQKLSAIEKWAGETFDQQLNFFLLGADQVRSNRYAELDAESSGSAQKTILKEEFYRTFIWVCGKIPFWAVLPAGLDNPSYDLWINSANTGPYNKIIEDQFIDLGNLFQVESEECLGAILWQVFKAKSDPAKALIKAALIAYFNFYSDADDLPCNHIKKQFENHRLDSHHADPYSVIFQHIMIFFNAINNAEIFETLRECVFLRLCGYPRVVRPVENSPKNTLLNRYVSEWKWPYDKTKRFLEYSAWPETDKKAYDHKLFQQISFLYELILKSRSPNDFSFTMDDQTLLMLKTQIAIHFTLKPGKINSCSTYLKAVSQKNFPVTVSCIQGPLSTSRWEIHRGDPETVGDPQKRIFSADGFLHVAGWLIRNQLTSSRSIRLNFMTNRCRINPSVTARLLNDVSRFMSPPSTSKPDLTTPPTWDSMVIVLDTDTTTENPMILNGAEILLRNTWHEFYFDAMDLTHIENQRLRCYEVGHIINNYVLKNHSGKLKYIVRCLKESAASQVIHNLVAEAVAVSGEAIVSEGEAPGSAPDKNPPLLDLL